MLEKVHFRLTYVRRSKTLLLKLPIIVACLLFSPLSGSVELRVFTMFIHFALKILFHLALVKNFYITRLKSWYILRRGTLGYIRNRKTEGKKSSKTAKSQKNSAKTENRIQNRQKPIQW